VELPSRAAQAGNQEQEEEGEMVGAGAERGNGRQSANRGNNQRGGAAKRRGRK